MIRKKIIDLAKNKNANELAVKDNNISYSYHDILEYAPMLSWLKNKRVVLAIPKSSDYVKLVFAAFYNQFTFIPMDLNQPLARNIQILDDIQPDLIITLESQQIGHYHTIGINNIHLERIENFYSNSYLAYIIYTSGSTGYPKGVMISSNGLDNIISQQVKTFNLESSNMFFYVNTVFDASISDILCSFMSGSCLFINDEIKTKFKSLEKYIVDNNINYIDLPPSILSYIDIKKLNTLETIVVGGEIPNFKAIQESVEYVDIFNVYGPTEVSICTSIYKCDKFFNKANIGYPINNIEYHVINNELYIKGIGLAIGYTNPDLNTVFLDIDGSRYYKTGDIVEKTDDGYIFIGREDSQIKYKGQLVNLEEINIAVKSLDNVKDCFSYFNNNIYLFIEGIENEINLELLKKTIPSYMIPKFIYFHSNFKRNSSNKIEKEDILNQYDFFLINQSKKLANFKSRNREIETSGTLLTGANGFLGCHLLAEMTHNEEIYCLIRAKSIEIAKEKLYNSLQKYSLKVNYSNIHIVLGDITKPDLGIHSSEKKNYDRIIHCAANVNNLKSHKQLFEDNVLSSINIINYCQKYNIKKIEYISTLSVYVSSNYNSMQVFKEVELESQNRKFNSGYSSSKFQSEYMFQLYKKIFPNVSIYRLGLLTESISSNFTIPKSFLKLTYQSLQKIENVPNSPLELYIDLSPVCMVSNHLYQLFKQNKSDIYHLSYNIKLKYKEMVVGKNQINNEEWFIKYKNHLISQFLSIINPLKKEKINMNIFETTWVQKFDNTNLENAIGILSIDENKIKNHYFKIWSNE